MRLPVLFQPILRPERLSTLLTTKIKLVGMKSLMSIKIPLIRERFPTIFEIAHEGLVFSVGPQVSL